MDSVREEIAGIGNEYNQAALNLGILSQKGILQDESCPDPDHESNQ